MRVVGVLQGRLCRAGPGAVWRKPRSSRAARNVFFVADTGVGHHPLDLNADARIVGHRILQESHAAQLRLVGQHCGDRDARVIVDGQMDGLSTLSLAAVGPAFAGDAVTTTLEWGSHGSTTIACSRRSATSRRPRQRQTTSGNSPVRPSRPDSHQPVSLKAGAVHADTVRPSFGTLLTQYGAACAFQSCMVMAVLASSSPELRWRGNHSFPATGRASNLYVLRSIQCAGGLHILQEVREDKYFVSHSVRRALRKLIEYFSSLCIEFQNKIMVVIRDHPTLL